MAEEVKLIGMWVSPFSHAIKLALKMKGIEYEYIEEDLSNKSPMLLNYNPVHKKVPVLLHNGKPISESLVILEYIDETWQDYPILPKDPYARSMARFWATFVHAKMLPAALMFFAAKGKEQEQMTEEFHQQLKFLENDLKEKEFFGGQSIGYLDIATFFIIYEFGVGQEVMQVELMSEEKFPAMYKWIAKLLHIDSVKECLPPRDKHIALLRARIEPPKSD